MGKNSSQARVWGLGVLALCSLGAYLIFRSAPPAPPSAAGPKSVTSSPLAATADNPAEPASARVPKDAVSTSVGAPAAPSELPSYQGPVRNAQQAALIREALIARKAVQSGSAMPEPVGAGNQANKPLGDYVARTMREQFLPLATECYETLLEAHPGAAGNVALEFSVLGDPAVGGVVVDVTLGPSTTLTNDDFRTCMSESMYSIVFDAPPGKDGSVSVKQSFELAP